LFEICHLKLLTFNFPNPSTNLSVYTPYSKSSIKTPAAKKSEVVFTSIIAVLVFIFCGLSLIYLSHANMVATKGYKIKKLQEDRSQLQAELDVWNLKLARLQSVHSLDNSSKITAMQKTEEAPQFIKTDTQVALK
jgi:hypothetical protein